VRTKYFDYDPIYPFYSDSEKYSEAAGKDILMSQKIKELIKERHA
jgi:hypothetical protein